MNYNINRFLIKQNKDYSNVIKELRNGKKVSHWIWYIFPQLRFLGKSDLSYIYGISSLEEAKQYMNNDTLRLRYLECCKALKQHYDKNIEDILSKTDAIKLRSSLTLFSCVDFSGNEILNELLEHFYNNTRCELTLHYINLGKNN